MRRWGVDEVLAVEPGSYELELERHHQFAADRFSAARTHREWFRPGGSLIALTRTLRATYGLPNYRGQLACNLSQAERDRLALLPPLVITVWPGTLERFAEEITVDPAGGCWQRTPQIGRKGYGRFSLDGRRYESHAASYLMFVGPIPDGYVIDHLCHDPGVCQLGPACPHRCCVNPAHLEPVLPLVNLMRGGAIPAINIRKTHCKRGHEFTPENTYIPPLGASRPGRGCKICMHERSLARSPGTIGAANRAKTHCKYGHPFDEANTYWTSKGRHCKECTLRRTRERRARLKAQGRGDLSGPGSPDCADRVVPGSQARDAA
jgi:hypothetical protein